MLPPIASSINAFQSRSMHCSEEEWEATPHDFLHSRCHTALALLPIHRNVDNREVVWRGDAPLHWGHIVLLGLSIAHLQYRQQC